jgi:hypothetical protein
MSRLLTAPSLAAASLTLLILAPLSGVAASGSQNVSSACATLEFMAKMLTINTLLPAHRDSYGDLQDMNRQLQELNELVCQRVILTRDTRGDSRYSNGSRVSSDLYYDPWYFPNGQLFLSRPGEDVTLYYPNGQPLAYHWMHGGQALFWPNGRLATNAFRTFDVTWYYPDGNIITYESGYQGGRWFYPIPRLDGRPGQQLIASDWGIEDRDFNYLNFEPDGYLTITRERIRRKLVLDDLDLLDVPGVLLLVTRLYGVQDKASLFMPPDASITGAPF